jgi:hypothetical protein
MVVLGFFILLRPGEYAKMDNPDATPFRFQDIHLLVNNVCLDTAQCSEQDLLSVMHVALKFTNQKNGVRGELVGLGRLGHTTLCPVLAIIERVKHLRLHQAHPNSHLYQYFNGLRWTAVTTVELTTHFRLATSILGHTVGILPSDISVWSLQSSGAMALLCANVDPDKIQLLGRWRSDEMLRYAHVQALPIVAPLASLMVQHGYFTLLPNNNINMG